MTRRYRMPRTLEESMDQAVVADRHKAAAAAAPIVSPAPPAVETDTPAVPPAAGDDQPNRSLIWMAPIRVRRDTNADAMAYTDPWAVRSLRHKYRTLRNFKVPADVARAVLWFTARHASIAATVCACGRTP